MLISKSYIYRTMAEHLNKKCRELQMYNGQYVQRILKIKKIRRRRKRDVEILKARLDRLKDNWRAVAMKRQLAPHPKRKTEQKRGPKPKMKSSTEMPTPLNEDDQSKESNMNQTAQQQLLQFQHRQQIETDWSTLNDPEQTKIDASFQLG